MTLKRKDKACRVCKKIFTPQYNSMGQICCSLPCALAHSRAKGEVEARKQHSKLVKKRRAAVKTPTKWASEAQAAFNGWIKLRDWGKPCCSCDRPHTLDHQRHASHYRTVKRAKQLRYNGWNVATSCAQCNTHDSGNIVEYRIRLVDRIGKERVEALERNNDLCTHNIEYYKRVKKIFSKRTRLYKKIKGIP